MSKTSVDVTWEKLFATHDILNEISSKGYFIISANDIKKVKEPRLVTKFDHSINLPQLFKKYNISILPISRGEYLLSNHNMFFEYCDSQKDIVQKSLPSNIESIDISNITSESIALNTAFISGMLEDFLEDTNIYPTVSGRMGSGKFGFKIQNVVTKSIDLIEVEKSQIEIDGAYEGDRFLTLVEAKQNVMTDFLVRQLYYPFRVWKEKISKEVKIVYLLYTNSIFTFSEYEFTDPESYSSIRLVKQKKYTLEDITINSQSLYSIIESTTIVNEPQVPFPQADDFDRVINLCELAYANDLTKAIIASEYEFDERQSDYYTNAGKYLGLLDKVKNGKQSNIILTERGLKALKMNYADRQLYFAKLILEHHIFSDVLKLTFKNGQVPSTKEILHMMKDYTFFNVGSKKIGSSTFYRRASTVRGWVQWIVSLIEE